jgi:hypothetical protein
MICQEGFEKDSTGTIVMSRLNEGILKVLSHESGGNYVSLTADDSDVKKIASYVTLYEKEKFDNKSATQWNEYYFVAAALSLLAFLLEWII